MEIKKSFASGFSHPASQSHFSFDGKEPVKATVRECDPNKMDKLNQLGQKYNMKFVSAKTSGKNAIKL